MAALESTKSRGWSYSVGYSHAVGQYVARAWRERPRPYTYVNKFGAKVTLVLHSLSGQGATVDAAAEACAAEVVLRESGVENYQREG